MKLSLNRNQLKYLVIITMLIDHIAWAFVPTASVLGQVMHFIGRLTGPTMAFFVAEGYRYTRDVKKYSLRLGVFALLSWFPYVYFEYGTLPIVIQNGAVVAFHPQFGVIYTLLLGLLAIWLWDKGKCSYTLKLLGVFGLCMLSVFGDWPIFNVLYCMFFYIYRDNPKAKWTAFCWITAVCCMFVLFAKPWWAGLFQFGIFMVPLFIQFCYNGESGSKKAFHKWFFYVFYPVHLLVLGVLAWVILQ